MSQYDRVWSFARAKTWDFSAFRTKWQGRVVLSRLLGLSILIGAFHNGEWNFLEPYMKKNAKWLNKLSKRSDAMVIRYEDFFLKFDKTTKKIEEYCGPFLEKFPTPRKNPTRMYWSNRYKTKIDLSAFEALKSLFINSVKYFYPEKLPISYNT